MKGTLCALASSLICFLAVFMGYEVSPVDSVALYLLFWLAHR